MKKQMIVLALILCFFSASAQNEAPRNYFLINTGISYHQFTENVGPSYSNHYLLTFGRFLALGAGLHFSQSISEEETNDSRIMRMMTNFHAYFRPLNSGRHTLLIGTGPRIVYTTKSSSLLNTSIEPLYEMSFRSVSCHYLITVYKNWFMGVNLQFDNFERTGKDDSQFNGGISAGITL